MHQVDDVLPDGRRITKVDATLRRYATDGSLEDSGVEYTYTLPEDEGAETAPIRRFQTWGA